MFKLLKKLILRRKLKQVSKKFKEESIPLIEEVFSSLPEMVDSDGGPAAPIVFTAVDDICTSPYGYKRSIHRAWRHSFYVLRQDQLGLVEGNVRRKSGKEQIIFHLLKRIHNFPFFQFQIDTFFFRYPMIWGKIESSSFEMNIS
ncbi:uncharacterized protein [Parasteatoda tepidariorum]|uniref:uncharacterized protein isoform X1 n=1 Tax=Parasteatoda tepidariorum TaxID=114398 RepID=UPI001C721159|nr:uncharacterized protein LOC122271503 isoform X1 [Parasteatoda tepidariorum]